MALSGSGARRYAEAILDLAAADRAVDTYRVSLDALAVAITPQVIRVLRDPSVPVKRRLAAVDAATQGHPRAIAREFGDLVDRRAGIVTAKITTAVPLDDAQEKTFVARLEKSSGKKLRATFAVDDDLIGGARVQLGDHLIDSSVRAQLAALRSQLAGI